MEHVSQPAVYALRSALIDDFVLILARTQVRAIQLAMSTYGGTSDDWEIQDVCFSLDESEAVEIGRRDPQETLSGGYLWKR